MTYKVKPFKNESLPNTVLVDGFAEKNDVLGPYRVKGKAVYYDPVSAKFLDARSNSYIMEGGYANV
tara:strand:- start:2639 stop:2836 length:198 start_codon:yes stop_codon:yes gene_type:complete